MAEKFEQQLNEAAKGSYEVKTTSGAILSAYQERKPAPRTPSYKRPFFVALSAFGAAVVALAIYIPLSLRKGDSSLNLSSYSELSYSPLKTQKGTLGYEVASVYPLLKRLKTSVPAISHLKPLQREEDESENETSDSEQERFEKTVETYEKFEAPIHQALKGGADDFVLTEGSFVGSQATYAYSLALPDEGALLFNVELDGSSWKSLSGEVSEEGEVAYLLTGTNSVVDGANSLHLTLTGEEGFSCAVEQLTAKGKFFFSFSVYDEQQLDYAFTLALVQYENVLGVHANYYLGEEGRSGSLSVIAEGSEVYGIYGTELSKILLTYKNNERHYSYSSFEKVED
jgi:hypothetical protein